MREQWFQLLRKQLKSEHGKGWGVRAMRGKVQLTLRVDENAGMNNPRNSLSLPLKKKIDKLLSSYFIPSFIQQNILFTIFREHIYPFNN